MNGGRELRVTYVGNFEPEYSTENDIRKALETMGHEVTCIQEDKTRTLELAGTDLLLWTSTWDDTPLAHDIDRIRHDCAYHGVTSAAVHLDVFWGTDRSGRPWHTNPMWKLQHAFTADGDHPTEFDLFGVNHHWLPPGVRHDACHLGTYRAEHDCDVAFVGSNGVGYHEDVWPYRRQLVDQLRSMCARRGWTFRNPGGDDPKIDRDDNMNDFYASAKVTVGDSLCPLREHSRYWSDRVYEATGRGGLLVMPEIDALRWSNDGFGGDMPLYPWGDWEHLEATIEDYLNHPEMRSEVAGDCATTTTHTHTYTHRMQTLLQTLGLT